VRRRPPHPRLLRGKRSRVLTLGLVVAGSRWLAMGRRPRRSPMEWGPLGLERTACDRPERGSNPAVRGSNPRGPTKRRSNPPSSLAGRGGTHGHGHGFVDRHPHRQLHRLLARIHSDGDALRAESADGRPYPRRYPRYSAVAHPAGRVRSWTPDPVKALPRPGIRGPFRWWYRSGILIAADCRGAWVTRPATADPEISRFVAAGCGESCESIACGPGSRGGHRRSRRNPRRDR